MTIDEAIKILEDILEFVAPGDPPEEHDAVKLSIEALRSVQENRRYKLPSSAIRLPGETE